MANDKFFQKTRQRRKEEKRRVKAERKEKRRFLIVCEGQTEKAYADFYAKNYPDLICDTTHDCGTSPRCIVQYALEQAKKDDDYDHVFAMFDGDIQNEENFSDALRLIDGVNSKNSGTKFSAIHSTPCFEYWLYLHFRFERKPFKGTPESKSAGTQMSDALKTCQGMESYTKGTDLNFTAFAGKLDTAIRNAERIEEQASGDGQRNPSTMVHHLHRAFDET